MVKDFYKNDPRVQQILIFLVYSKPQMLQLNTYCQVCAILKVTAFSIWSSWIKTAGHQNDYQCLGNIISIKILHELELVIQI